jgi:hypothetical protein
VLERLTTCKFGAPTQDGSRSSSSSQITKKWSLMKKILELNNMSDALLTLETEFYQPIYLGVVIGHHLNALNLLDRKAINMQVWSTNSGWFQIFKYIDEHFVNI